VLVTERVVDARLLEARQIHILDFEYAVAPRINEVGNIEHAQERQIGVNAIAVAPVTGDMIKIPPLRFAREDCLTNAICYET
jgi:hypothetical protein